ncbi:26S proteasome non-ATPase regulatory subunit 10 [Pelomyxa schiedti]|nr:26S proteasome non-ATPase regulatory subunit 10 [Pelomyxa schiedti]
MAAASSTKSTASLLGGADATSGVVKEFFDAVQSGNVERVSAMITSRQVTVDQPDSDKRTAFHWGCSRGDVAMASRLMELGADTQPVDGAGWTPLMSASSAGHVPIVQMLLRVPDIGVNTPNNQGNTALQYACSKGHVEIVQKLLAAGAKPSIRDRYGNTSLHRASSSGHLAVVDLLLSCRGINVDSKNQNGETPLHVAVSMRHKDIAMRLVAAGASPNEPDSDNTTPLISASLDTGDHTKANKRSVSMGPKLPTMMVELKCDTPKGETNPRAAVPNTVPKKNSDAVTMQSFTESVHSNVDALNKLIQELADINNKMLYDLAKFTPHKSHQMLLRNSTRVALDLRPREGHEGDACLVRKVLGADDTMCSWGFDSDCLRIAPKGTGPHPARDIPFIHAPRCPMEELEASMHTPPYVGIAVSVIIIRKHPTHGQQVLITRRLSTMRIFPGCWVLPGGHVDNGETLETAVARETFEETGLTLTPSSITPLCLYESVYPPKIIEGAPKAHHIVFYFSAEIEGEQPLKFSVGEVDSAAWLTVEELKRAIDDSFTGEQSFSAFSLDGTASSVPLKVLQPQLQTDGYFHNEVFTTGGRLAIGIWLTKQ